MLWRSKRVVGGIAFCVLSLVACVLVARRLTGTSWPLEGARVPLVCAAAAAYLASFGFRGAGWQQLFPSSERPDRARCMAACGASAATGVVLPFRLDYVVKIVTLRGLAGVRVSLGTIGLSILALGLVDAVAMLPLAISALATSSALVRAPLIVVVVFCGTCLAILALGRRTVHLPFVHRSRSLQSLSRRVAETTRLSRSTLTAGLLLFGCWTSRALGSTVLLCALDVRFSPTLALVVVCLSAAASILPITAGGAVAGIGATAGVLVLLGVPKEPAVNFSLASGLLLTTAALVAAAVGLAASLVLVLRRRRGDALAAVSIP
jgi:Lysylphosphatidylglycerol synthase TM region